MKSLHPTSYSKMAKRNIYAGNLVECCNKIHLNNEEANKIAFDKVADKIREGEKTQYRYWHILI
jgi:hypothetical protein